MKKLKDRDGNEQIAMAVHYQLLPLDFHFFLSTKPERESKGEEGSARHTAQENQRRGSATKKANLILETPRDELYLFLR